MATYSYVTRNAEGQILTGTLESLSLDAARASLREMDMDIITLKETTKAAPSVAPVVSDTWVHTEEPEAPKESKKKSETLVKTRSYFPLMDTFRLYAGWLLAWYAFIFAVGSYQLAGHSPIRVPFVEDLAQSSVVLHVSFAVFLFLLGTGIQERVKGGRVLASILGILGVLLFFMFYQNT